MVRLKVMSYADAKRSFMDFSSIMVRLKGDGHPVGIRERKPLQFHYGAIKRNHKDGDKLNHCQPTKIANRYFSRLKALVLLKFSFFTEWRPSHCF
jgi:hypothetical protein